VPDITAVRANLKTIKLEASFSKLSPSIIVTNLFGIFTSFKMDVAATASGGDMMAPNKNPNGKVKPGMTELDTKAITHDVRITIPKAKEPMTLRHFQKSFHEVCHAASYNSGGRKMRNISSGSISGIGKPGTNPSIKPPSTKTIG
jgi:hypothetical protein